MPSRSLRTPAVAALVVCGLSAAAGHASCGGDAPATTVGEAGSDAAADASAVDGMSGDDAGPADASVATPDTGPVFDAGPLADAALLSDPGIWTAVPGSGSCILYEAKSLPDPFPRRVWQGCGVGCLLTSAGMPIATLGNSIVSLSGGASLANEAFLQIVTSYGSATLAQVFRVSDGATIAAVNNRKSGTSACLYGSLVGDAPLFLTPLRQTPSGYRPGRAQPQPGVPVQWQADWIADPSVTIQRFAFDEGVGWGFYDGSIRLLPSADAGALTLVDQQNAQMAGTSGRGNLLVWSLWTTGGGDIRAYSRANGALTLLSLQGSWASAVRLGDDRMLWIAVQGPNTLNGTYTAAQFAWSPLASRPQDVSITMGPSIPAQTRLSSLAIGGDYAATIGCEDSASNPDCRLFVVQFSTKRLWTLHHRPGANVFADVMAVTPTEIIVSEQDDLNQFFTRLLRIEIAHLGDLGW